MNSITDVLQKVDIHSLVLIAPFIAIFFVQLFFSTSLTFLGLTFRTSKFRITLFFITLVLSYLFYLIRLEFLFTLALFGSLFLALVAALSARRELIYVLAMLFVLLSVIFLISGNEDYAEVTMNVTYLLLVVGVVKDAIPAHIFK